MSESPVIFKVKKFFKKDPEFRFPATVRENTSLVQAGVFDSFSVIKLVTFLEKEFKIRIKPEDLLEENFSTLKQIEKLVLRKQKKK
ncbi:MAG TPA: acyl carrier protein [Verrucomicrobiae bacterium]|jgi:acyl carrier protein|nr:acyl carrier protein [Verrucomicrobiae bacterium]